MLSFLDTDIDIEAICNSPKGKFFLIFLFLMPKLEAEKSRVKKSGYKAELSIMTSFFDLITQMFLTL